MPRSFISYRQLNDSQRERVRGFAERLRGRGVEVVLDQFYLEDKSDGPDEGWPKWSSDQAIQTERVIIIGTQAWFRCFDGKEKPGTGQGAACEAHDLRQRIYDSANLNENIRVVLFDDSEAEHISFKLKGYHHFHAERDFEAIVQWLAGTAPRQKQTPGTTTPNNLPRLHSFFGREKELKTIADALAPKTRTWGALIDGPGGIGKTSLAVRAAELAPPGQFQRILFLSSKERRMTADGERRLSDFVVPGYLDMLNEMARLLKQPDLAKLPEAERARRIIEALEPERALLILDNLESLPKDQQNQLFEFLSQLPQGCKAIATSRRRTDVDARIIRLEKLDQQAALDLLTELATDRPLLAKATEAERVHLYEETGGNPLLLRWIAGQLGKGKCRTVASSLEFLRSAPADNDPLEFIFGDLLETFTESETKVLAALTHFTQMMQVKFIAELGDITKTAAQTALGDLASRALVVPDEAEEHFALVPMVADFLRRERPEAVRQTGDRLADRAYALAVENGFDVHDRFPVLDGMWPTIEAALPHFLVGPNDRLQTMCGAVRTFLNFTGRWDQWLALSLRAEGKTVAAGDFLSAGWRAHDAGLVHNWRKHSREVLACADRAEDHWCKAKVGAREQGVWQIFRERLR